MTEEQEKVIYRLKAHIRHSDLSNDNLVVVNKTDIETVLNMLKEKYEEIEKYKELLSDNLARILNDNIKAKNKADKELEYLNEGWKLELEKKDKIIEKLEKEAQGYFETTIIQSEQFSKELKEKDKEIESIRYIKNSFDYVVQKETEKKNKIIDLMAEFIYTIWCDYPGSLTKRLKDNGFDDKECGTCENKEKNCLDCIKQYFKSKAEKE